MRDDSALAKFFYPYDTLLNRPSVRDKLIVLVTMVTCYETEDGCH